MTDSSAWPFHDGPTARLVCAHDWTSTPIGPITSWPDELKAAVVNLLGSPLPGALLWGPELVTIHNDAFGPLLVDGPDALGRPFREILDGLAPMAERSLGGKAICVENHRLPAGEPRQLRMVGFTLSFSPVRAADGTVLGVSHTAVQTAERVELTRAVTSGGGRLGQIGDASPDILWLRDAETLQWTYLTPAFEPIYGIDREQVLAGDNYRNWLDLVLPEDRGPVKDAIARVRDGEWVTIDYRIRHGGDGSIRWVRDTTFPILDRSGKVILIGGIGHDLTELRRTKQRFRTLVERVPQLVWMASDAGHWVWASPQWTEYTGQSEQDSLDHGWLEPLHPDDQALARLNWAKAVETERLDMEARIRQAGSGQYRWFQIRATPARGADGKHLEWLGTCTDIQHIKELQQRQEILLAELQHRVRNLLSMIRAIVRQSAYRHGDVEDYVAHLIGRLNAMGRTQVRLTRAADISMDLHQLVREELEAYSGEVLSIHIDGPATTLSPKAAEVLTLALHELATNSVKYGAARDDDGTISVVWSRFDRDGEPWLKIEWTETMRQHQRIRQKRGFGTELIEDRLPYELKGEGRMRLTSSGLVAEMAFPLRQQASVLESSGAGG